MDLLRAALIARSIPGNHSVAKQKLWVGCVSMFYARIPSESHPLLEPSQHFKCPHQDVGCTARSIASSAGARLHGLFDLLLDGFLVEARALLHRRKIDRGPGEFGHLLLHEHEAPELKPPPIGCKDRLVVTGCRESLFDP